MATGILSIATLDVSAETLSRVLLVIAAFTWIVLGIVFVGRAGLARSRWREDASQPAALTAVAATAVLGVRVSSLGWTWQAWVLLVLAACLCAGLLPTVLASRSLPARGSSFLLTVAPQSLTVLGALLAARYHLAWLEIAALVPLLAGGAAYLYVLWRFDFEELRRGRGDHWVTGGALAITTLACSELANAAGRMPSLHGLQSPLRTIGLVLWALTMVWLSVLLAAELQWPRWRYDVRRWATIFPLGMYAAMSVSLGTTAGVTPMLHFGQVWAWVAFAAWGLTAIGSVTAASPRLHARRPTGGPRRRGG